MPASRFRKVALTLLLVCLFIPPAASLSATPLDPENDPGSNARYGKLAVADRLFHLVFVAGNAETHDNLIAVTAPVYTSFGEFTGPGGVMLYLNVLHATHPGAEFERTEMKADGNLVSVQWRGESAAGPLWGRMTAVVDAGSVVELAFFDIRA